jgi:hypothetical protein
MPRKRGIAAKLTSGLGAPNPEFAGERDHGAGGGAGLDNQFRDAAP